jgi:hypothetical protein
MAAHPLAIGPRAQVRGGSGLQVNFLPWAKRKVCTTTFMTFNIFRSIFDELCIVFDIFHQILISTQI